MTSQINRQYQLAQRPSGLPGRDTFSFVETRSANRPRARSW